MERYTLMHRINGATVSWDAARRVISLPMHPYLTDEQQKQVVEALAEATA